ncbi:MAG: HupE/UreJ family protein [Saprospiraceae bacterium]|nr:HupE/UreJ family protein [Saprospiraceae bacterium]
MFSVYLELGFDHISDLKGFDHILFIIALCAVFSVSDWKKILILVTAFTLGHSITLALSALQIINISPYLIELLIPVTILLTALQNFWFKPDQHKRWNLQYFLALFFGFIHGMGFSNFFRSLLGQEADILLPLFAFNVGVEVGQLCIVACIMVADFLIVKLGKVKQQYWNVTVSVIAVVLSVLMIMERI